MPILRITNKFLVILFGLLAFASTTRAQSPVFGIHPIITVTVAPSGSCTSAQPLQLLVPSGILYSCQNGTWGQYSTGATGSTDKFITGQLGFTITSAFTTNFFPATTQAMGAVSAELTLGTAPVGCSTFPALAVWDNTAGAAIASATTVGSTLSYAMTINEATVPSGHVIALRVTTAAVGCSTNASIAYFNLLYH